MEVKSKSMRQKILHLITTFGLVALAASCNSNTQKSGANNASSENYIPTKTDTVVLSLGANNKGIGRFKNVELTHPLDESMVQGGQSIYDAKCSSCHKLTDEKLVGPGWKGVTDRRTPEWILNFVTNTNVMLDSDLAAQAMLVTCLVRMPSQNLSDDDARHVMEFMRKNDGKN